MEVKSLCLSSWVVAGFWKDAIFFMAFDEGRERERKWRKKKMFFG